MNRREAKRQACNRAAGAIDSALAAGWDNLDEMYGEDADKIRDALTEIVAELDRRAAGRTP
jgi:hypothetical protein